MKRHTKYLIGSLFIFSGSLLLGLIHIAVAIYMPHMTGWGKSQFASAINELKGWIPYSLGIAQLLIGLILILNAYSERRIEKVSES